MLVRLRGLSGVPSPAILYFFAALQVALVHQSACAINITVDYRYDTNGFFASPARRAAIEAAASRYSAIITTSLSAVALNDNLLDPRIGFRHPGTGAIFQVSPAASENSDAVKSQGGAANEYRGPWSIAADQWIVYAGGRLLPTGTVSEGGTRTGANFPDVYWDAASHVNRGFRPVGSDANLPVWGGSVWFDNNTTTLWHDNHTTAPPTNAHDLYTFALHEIGHTLGLSTSGWLEWLSHITAGTRLYRGEAVSAYNADNGAARTTLNVHAASPLNPHWQMNAYKSFIFGNANPNLVGSVGLSELQDLLMEPIPEKGRRLELTNVDVAALRDVGWSTVPQPPITQPGDFNGDGIVNAADYVLISKGLTSGAYATWRANFGESLPPALAAASSNVPEPASVFLIAVAIAFRVVSRRSR